MDFRRLLRPLPLVLIFLFVAVAVADLVQTLTEEPPPPPEIMRSTSPRFQAREPVIDFRPGGGDPEVLMLPVPELAHDRWSAPKSQGVWAKGAAADIQLDFEIGGFRLLILECRPASGKDSVRELRLTVNGINCGAVDIESEWMRYRLAVPEGAVRPGANRVVFTFPDRDRTERPGRSLLIRKLGWFLDDTVGVEVLDDARSVSLDLDAERVTIRRSGTLEIPLVLDDRSDSLQMRYRFPSGAGRAEVMVEQSGDEGVGLDKAKKTTVTADDKSVGRLRIPLHGRRGTYVVRIRADLGPPDSQLLISSLRLVEEGDPSRRPRAANPSLH
jgi:hypothetical protein